MDHSQLWPVLGPVRGQMSLSEPAQHEPQGCFDLDWHGSSSGPSIRDSAQGVECCVWLARNLPLKLVLEKVLPQEAMGSSLWVCVCVWWWRGVRGGVGSGWEGEEG